MGASCILQIYSIFIALLTGNCCEHKLILLLGFSQPDFFLMIQVKSIPVFLLLPLGVFNMDDGGLLVMKNVFLFSLSWYERPSMS